MAGYNATVIVTSDSCFENPTSDESGSYVVEQLRNSDLFTQVKKQIVKDEISQIVNCIKSSLASQDPALLITIGGTGLCPRDVTPEATSSLYDKTCSGITTGLHFVGLRYGANAALSRLTSGIIGGTLVVNFPGKQRACKQYMPWLLPILEHALEQVRYDFHSYTLTHKRQQEADLELQSVQPDDSASNAPSSLMNGRSKVNGDGDLPNIGQLKLIRSPATSTTSKTKKKKNVPIPKRDPAPITNQSKITIESIMESRSEFPIADTRSEIGGNKRHNNSKGPSSVRSLKTRIITPKKHGTTTSTTTTTTTNLPKTRIMPLVSEYPLIDFKQSFDILAEMSRFVIDGEPIEYQLNSYLKANNCLGAILARDITPKRLVPPYNVSTMDGYVLNIPASMKKDKDGRVTTPGVARLVPGLLHFIAEQKKNKESFICYQVNTGGRLPLHSYAVVPVEKTGQVQDGQVPVFEVKQGAFVRREGTDVGKEDRLLAGTVIGHIEMSVIMAMGHKSLLAYQRPKIGILSTGDELEDFFASSSSQTGADSSATIADDGSMPVVDVNGPLLTSLFRLKSFFTVSLGVARDDPDEICEKLEEGLKKCDIILVSGGASMGSKDHVKSVISHLGGKIHFGRVNMKPGRPVAFASLVSNGRTKFIFSLPGNPVSAYITTTVLVMPFIQHGMSNHTKPGKPISFNSIGDMIEAEIGELVDGNIYYFEGRLEILRAKIIARMPAEGVKSVYVVSVSVKQQSSRMLNLVDCDCLIMIDPELKGKSLRPGLRFPALKLPRHY